MLGNRVLPALCIALIVHSADRIVSFLDKFTNEPGKEHVSLDVIRNFLGMIIQPGVDFLLYLRMLTVAPFPFRGQRVGTWVWIGHWTLWSLTCLVLVLALPVAVTREYLEVAYYGEQDLVFGALRPKISAYYQGFTVALGAVCTLIFFLTIWNNSLKYTRHDLNEDDGPESDDVVAQQGSGSRERGETPAERKLRNIRYFVNKNLALAAVIICLCCIYSVVNIVSNTLNTVSILLQVISVISIRFILDVMREL
ncbi:hypothetical protein HK101_005015, partial [Irineochytrium annulatum]